MTAAGGAPRDNAYAAADWGQAHAAERFVAVWLDGATAHVQFTSALTPAELASLRAAVPAPDTLRVDTVQNSLRDLLSVRDAITTEASDLRAREINIVGVGLRHSTNRVGVTDKATEASRAAPVAAASSPHDQTTCANQSALTRVRHDRLGRRRGRSDWLFADICRRG